MGEEDTSNNKEKELNRYILCQLLFNREQKRKEKEEKKWLGS